LQPPGRQASHLRCRGRWCRSIGTDSRCNNDIHDEPVRARASARVRVHVRVHVRVTSSEVRRGTSHVTQSQHSGTAALMPPQGVSGKKRRTVMRLALHHASASSVDTRMLSTRSHLLPSTMNGTSSALGRQLCSRNSSRHMLSRENDCDAKRAHKRYRCAIRARARKSTISTTMNASR
jgi:hypothetical protein